MTEAAVPTSDTMPDPLGSSFGVALKMIADWHVGSGAGRPGGIDRLVRRDSEDLPYIPAKTLTGIWRDACERVALGLDDNNKSGTWSQWVAYLFGDQPAIEQAERTRAATSHTDQDAERPSPPDEADWHQPRQAVLSVRSAHLPSELRRALAGKLVAREAVTFIKPGISIHPRTGRARTDFLRFEEMARGGVSLSALCELRRDLDEGARRIASALLVAGARMVERLGGKRRRGAGRCELVIAGCEEIEPWLVWLENHPQPEPPPSRESDDRPKHDDAALESGDWLRIRLILTTKLPIIVPSGTIGNLIETLDYIPGTYLLPHVTRNLNGVNVHSAIARGDVVVTNATVELESENGRPVPFCLAYPKGGRGLEDGKDVFNQLCELGPYDKQLKNHRAGYVGSTEYVKPGPGGRLPIFDKLDSQVETHNVVDDDYQRPTQRVGGVYSYQSIPPCVTLRAELRLRQSLADGLSAKDPKWFEKLEGSLRIGRASKDDYGAVELRVIGRPESMPYKQKSVKDELTVWLLSDLLLRNERLRSTASIEDLRLEMADRLGLDHGQIKASEAVPSMRAVLRQRRTDSWHVGWGLPRPSLAGLQAGSCAVFKITRQVDQSRLNEIEASGLGERRAEGYGQVCFNDSLVTLELRGLTCGKPDTTEKTQGPYFIPKESSFDYAYLIEREATRNEMRRSASAVAADPGQREKALGILIKGKRGEPRMSQIGALRSALGRLQSPADRHRVLAWLKHLEQTPNRRKEWPLGSLQRIEELLTRDELVWGFLEVDFAKVVLTENGAETLKQELWPEAVRTLVDACGQAHKRDLEGD